jgi:uncharacterized protein DUF5666
MEVSKEMQFSSFRRAPMLGLILALLTGFTAAPASALLPGLPTGNANTVVRGTITALDAAAGTLQVTNRDGLSITLKTNASTTIRRDRKTATLADLKSNDSVLVYFNRSTMVATRIEASSPPPVDLSGTITSLDAGTGSVQLTTDHGTAITLTTNANTRIRLNGRATTVGNLAAGQSARATYQPEDKIALALSAETPRLDVVSGAITAIDLTAGTLQLTPLAGAPASLKLNANTQFRLNGRAVAPGTLAVGQLASVQTQPADTARIVAARTPPLIDLEGTISALDVAGGTFQVTTAAQTAITLRLLPTTAIQRDGAAATPDKLVIGDRVVVRYEYLLLPGQSRALRIEATSAPAAPTTPTTPTTPAVALASVALNPTAVVGGAAATGTVTLTAAAPAGGTVVTLSSSNTAVAMVPPSVMVPEGMTTTTFPVTTNAVTAATPVTITATLGSASTPATLTVNPPA